MRRPQPQTSVFVLVTIFIIVSLGLWKNARYLAGLSSELLRFRRPHGKTSLDAEANFAGREPIIAIPFGNFSMADETRESIHAHWQELGSRLARSFPPHREWCHKETLVDFNGTGKYKWKDPKGLFYVKVPKTASSTVAGIIKRTSLRHGGCTSQSRHLKPSGRHYGNRNRALSFLCTTVRDPGQRAISRVFFTYISQLGHNATDESILEILSKYTYTQKGIISQGQGGYQLRYITLQPVPLPWSAWRPEAPEQVLDRHKVEHMVAQIVQDYDFLLVVERLEESLVALQLLLGLDVGDILSVFSSKVGGRYNRYGNAQGHPSNCIEVQKAFVSPRVDAFLHSNEWYAKNYGDYLLHAAANRSLDLTIEALGEKRFEGALAGYRKYQERVNHACQDKVVYPCSPEGVDQLELSQQHCYSADEGCGYRCIDEMLKEDASLTT